MEYWRGGGAERKLCNKVKPVREFTYLGDKVSISGGYEAGMTAITRCGLVKLR